MTNRRASDMVYVVDDAHHVEDGNLRTRRMVMRIKLEHPVTASMHLCANAAFCGAWMAWRDDGNMQFLSQYECEMFDTKEAAEAALAAETKA